MISYRHHVMSLVAVFLALAVGVALGGGPLSELGRAQNASSSTGDRRAAEAEQRAAYGDEFARAGAAALYDGRLADHPVALVTLPGAEPDVVKALTAQVEAAGGTLAGRYELGEALLDPSEKTLLDTLGTELAAQVPAGTVDAETSTYPRTGQLLGLAVTSTKETGEEAGTAVLTVRETLAGADLLAAAPTDARRAPLALVVLGDRTDPDVLEGLLGGLADAATGVVVVGDRTSARGGDLASLRRSDVAESLTTVDGTESDLGRVTAVLALVRELDETGGAFGAAGSGGAVPLG